MLSFENFSKPIENYTKERTGSQIYSTTNQSLVSNTNFASDFSSLNSLGNSNSSVNINNRANKNTIGVGSLGMSALFYSFLKNNAKGNGSPVDSGYESRFDNSGIVNRASVLSPESENKPASLAQLKLKNLQEAIAKTYSKEEYSKYGIMVPNVQSASLTQNKENLNKIHFSNYPNSGSIDNPIDSKFNQKYINYNATSFLTKGKKILILKC